MAMKRPGQILEAINVMCERYWHVGGKRRGNVPTTKAERELHDLRKLSIDFPVLDETFGVERSRVREILFVLHQLPGTVVRSDQESRISR